MFISTVHVNSEAIRGASRILQGEIKATPATQALAKAYLMEAYSPRLLPVPLHYYSLAKAILDPRKWLNDKLAEKGVDLV